MKFVLASVALGLVAGVTAALTLKYVFHFSPTEKQVIIEKADCPSPELKEINTIAHQNTELSPSPVKKVPATKESVSTEKSASVKKTPKAKKAKKRKSKVKTKIKGIKKGILTVDGHNIHMSRKNLEELLSSKIHTLTKTAYIAPVLKEGKVDGFVMAKMVPGSIWDDMGIKANDVFVSVDSKPLRGVSEVLVLLQSLRNSSKVRIVINRSGRLLVKTLYFHR